jgi:hypothetical protein
MANLIILISKIGENIPGSVQQPGPQVNNTEHKAQKLQCEYELPSCKV